MGASWVGESVLPVPFFRMAATELYGGRVEQKGLGTSSVDAL